MDDPSVSVVIPAFCVDLTVDAAVQSAASQSCKPSEIIIVDDHSPTPVRFSSKVNGIPVITIRNPSNRGAQFSRNEGVRNASGRYVAFLDADDLWLDRKLETQLATIVQSGLQDRNFLCLSNLFIMPGDGGKRVANERPVDGRGNVLDQILVGKTYFHTSTFLLPRHLALENPFDERLRRHQDWDFVFSMSRRNVPFCYVPEPLSIYRIDDRASRMSAQKSAEPTMAWIEKVRDHLSDDALTMAYATVLLHKRVPRPELLPVLQHLIKAAQRGLITPVAALRGMIRLMLLAVHA